MAKPVDKRFDALCLELAKLQRGNVDAELERYSKILCMELGITEDDLWSFVERQDNERN